MSPLLLIAAAAAAQAPLQLETRMLTETRQAASDGTTRTVLGPPARVAPGDPVVVQVRYRNTGTAPIGGLVVANPVPAGLVYRGPRGAAPEVSVDGRSFAPLASLRVGGRPALPADVTHVRWRLAAPVPPGAGGELLFQAAVK